MMVISRKQARDEGLAFYYTGKPCVRGGYGRRRVSNKKCVCDRCLEALSKARKAIYWSDPDAHREQSRENHQRHRNSRLEAQKQYKDARRSELAAKQRAYYRENRESRATYAKAYALKNPGKILAIQHNRRVAKLNRTTSDANGLTAFVFSEASELCADREHMTGFAWHVDHMLPLQGEAVSGLHVWSNLQVIPAALNQSKRNKAIYTEPLEWLADARGMS